MRLYTSRVEPADSCVWQVNVGISAYSVLPLVEENEHRGTAQWLSREYRQQLDTGGGYLRDVG